MVVQSTLIQTIRNFKPKKGLDQHFLIDERVLNREVGYLDAKGREVLEIGAGIGTLTEKLARVARKIVAVEIDTRAIPLLVHRLSAFNNVEIVNADFLEMEIESVDRVISNVPYAISSPLLFKLADIEFSRAVLCLQKEFVDRMLAKPGTAEYSRLSVMTGLAFNTELMEIVPRSAFFPQPRIDSAIVKLLPAKTKLDEFSSELINLLFQHKNRTLRAALLASARKMGLEKEEMAEIAKKLELKDRRVFTLTREEIVSLCGELDRHLG